MPFLFMAPTSSVVRLLTTAGNSTGLAPKSWSTPGWGSGTVHLPTRFMVRAFSLTMLTASVPGGFPCTGGVPVVAQTEFLRTATDDHTPAPPTPGGVAW